MPILYKWGTAITHSIQALNQETANVAPKSVSYSSTASLNARIALVIGIHNMGKECEVFISSCCGTEGCHIYIYIYIAFYIVHERNIERKSEQQKERNKKERNQKH
jgi:hypothetical protein